MLLRACRQGDPAQLAGTALAPDERAVAPAAGGTPHWTARGRVPAEEDRSVGGGKGREGGGGGRRAVTWWKREDLMNIRDRMYNYNFTNNEVRESNCAPHNQAKYLTD